MRGDTQLQRAVDADDGVPSAPGFPPAEMERLAACLGRLLPHLRANDVAIAGGVAIQIAMAERGRQGSRAAIADLDLVAGSLEAVSSNVAEDLLVSHYHVVQPGVPKFMVQLVDPVTRIRVDIFPDLVGSLARTSEVRIGGRLTRLLALEDILEHKLLAISKASPTHPIDPKHAADAYALGELLRRNIPAVAHGSLLKDVYGTDADLACRRCELSSRAGFPLAPKHDIFRLLGYV